MLNIKNVMDKLIGRKKEEKLICQFCKEKIGHPAFVVIQGTIITSGRAPQIFTCPEQAFNYAQKIVVHDTCWIKMLREYGSKLYNMDDVVKKYKNKKKVI